ncbi:tetratricopeptide repeat protein [Thalassotalea litorea]|uniref:Ancillary SecYEG translocon subunit n=1 Tax=Thalassotalea litorea TaxID=2020715 RepID=A0A5R9IXW0_9GAMM|nr:tetratricopeptide repeat protein [Thalassotalea litorea]TLU66768.1 tetratricopeptide repeat protein [Thalassotalea litorea]
MEIYQSEEQQVEAIKTFWKENGNSIIAGLVIGLGGFLGYNYYQDSKIEAMESASSQYQQNIEVMTTDGETFRTSSQSFINDNKDSSYAAFSALALAKDAASHSDWKEAEKQLASAIELAPSDEVKAIAQLRLARVQIQQENIDGALATLGKSFPEKFQASVAQTKGDAYLLKGDKEQARSAYQAAADAGGLEISPQLQLKLDDLAVAVNLAD